MKFNNHETDLYILPESETERRRVIEVLDSIHLGYEEIDHGKAVIHFDNDRGY